MTTRWKSRRKTNHRRRVGEEWVCNEFPNCTCGRASRYLSQPLHQYTTGAKDIGDSFVILKCICEHVADQKVRVMALCQLIHPQYDQYHHPDEHLPWLFERLRKGAQAP